ncbi:hypothetical protein [Bergeyella zoohelcum]|uniref:Lipoprotein n=1 Tax=Bergeyella zoohelcum TaxID=1015 RepID=A0A376C1T8_9FLAO|nr:hypothetical protein [Bergeyella zoohelcum]EKB60700.1 hypothetical protein HMPREF9700_00195 [Bergeyella zoohelcum CCUG 30536]SSZ47210.1 Uncharacterised protein [Bergeyella zoohelcum]
MNKYILFFIVFIMMISCSQKNKEVLSLDDVRNNTNSSSYPSTKMDSVQAINSITKQKVREVLELSILYQNSNKNSEIDEAVHRQALGYFYKPDSLTLSYLLEDLDTLQVKNANIQDFTVEKRVFKKDTLNFATFSVEYFNKNNQSIGVYEREAQYILLPAEIQFKKEFKFFFLNFYHPILKEKTEEGIIK